MLVRTMSGPMREVWVENDPANFQGLQDFWVETSINPIGRNRPKDEIDYVEIYMYVDAVVGAPVIPDPEAQWAADGHLRVRVRQTSPGANGAAYTLDVRDNHSIVR